LLDVLGRAFGWGKIYLSIARVASLLPQGEKEDSHASRIGSIPRELLRCPWHGWEFDMRNGQSYFDPKRVRVRSYPVAIESGEELQKGPYVAETFPVHVEDSYVIIET
jgi:nitrite reductase/ring-hydroxylating ferredoxin subunit